MKTRNEIHRSLLKELLAFLSAAIFLILVVALLVVGAVI